MSVCGLFGKQQFKTPAIKCYLFCMRYLEIMGGSSDSFEQSIPLLEYNGGSGDSFEQSIPLLEYVLRGIKSDEAKKKCTWLPITHA